VVFGPAHEEVPEPTGIGSLLDGALDISTADRAPILSTALDVLANREVDTLAADWVSHGDIAEVVWLRIGGPTLGTDAFS
jgi:hypothetical protein